MTQNVILLSVVQFLITNDQTGEVENQGCTVRYCLTEDLSPHEDTKRSVKGHVPAKATIPHEDFDSFKTVPGLYEVTMTSRIDSKGVVSLVPTDFKLISGIGVTRAAGFGGKAPSVKNAQ